ncbi:hypothetical protein ACWGCW_07715 [Streptomyces sp. NPDC054933]
MGAGSVIAPGRNEKVLDELQRRFGARIRTVRLSGAADADRERMRAAAPGPIDAVLDLLPPSAGTTAGTGGGDDRPGVRHGRAQFDVAAFDLDGANALWLTPPPTGVTSA